MNVYDFSPDLDLSKDGEGVKGIEDGDGIVYAKVVSCVEVKDYGCEGCIFNDSYKNKSLLSRSVSCVDGEWLCRYEQAAIEGE